MPFTLTPALIKLFDVMWGKSLNDLKIVSELSGNPSLQSLHTRELSELRFAQFCIRREALKERKSNAYLLHNTEIALPFGKSITLISLLNLLLAFVGITGSLIAVWSIRPKELMAVFLLLLFSYLAISVFQFVLYLFSPILMDVFGSSKRSLTSYSVFLPKPDRADGKQERFDVKILQSRKNESYPFLGRPFLDEIAIYRRKDNAGTSLRPVEYELICRRKMTLLEIEWGLKLNRLGRFGRKACSYIPFILEGWEVTPSAYYLVLKETDTENPAQ